MDTGLRQSGIPILKDVPWGTHFCVFYHTPDDMLDILIPYFIAGLKGNEFCMWVTSEPLCADEAAAAMRRAFPPFNRTVERGQMEIIPHTEWYLKDGRFDSSRVLAGWIERLEGARSRGFEGLRLTGNTFWLEERHWQQFIDYERDINNVIGAHPMLALCTYSLDRCGAAEIIDVVSTHQFALVRRGRAWENIQSHGQRLVQEALRESLAKYRIVADNTYDFEFWAAPDGICLYASPSCERITGYTAAQFMADPALRRKIVHPEDRPLYDRHLRDIGRRRKLAELRFRIVRADGRVTWIGHACLPVVDKDGRYLGIRGSNRDITAQMHLEEGREHLASFPRYNPNPVMEVSRSGEVVFLNPAAKRAVRKLRPRGGARAFVPDNLGRIHRTLKGSAQKGVYREVPVKGRVFGETIHFIRRYDSFRIYAMDVTERLKAEKALRTQRDELEDEVTRRTSELLLAQKHLAEAKRLSDIGTLAATVAHELRNPLAAIRMAAYNISRKAQNPMLGKHIATIDKKVDDSNTIINNLLFYSRIKRPHYEKVNLASVLRECIHAARKRCPGHTVALTRKFGPIGRTPLDADPLQLKELFGNILNNSFDALHDCKGSITIEAARDSHDRVSVRISDDGIGISADDLRRVTEPFFSTKSKGTGLGLTVCKQIVDIHRGTLRIESEPGGGTRVTVTLPLRAPREGTE